MYQQYHSRIKSIFQAWLFWKRTLTCCRSQAAAEGLRPAADTVAVDGGRRGSDYYGRSSGAADIHALGYAQPPGEVRPAVSVARLVASAELGLDTGRHLLQLARQQDDEQAAKSSSSLPFHLFCLAPLHKATEPVVRRGIVQKLMLCWRTAKETGSNEIQRYLENRSEKCSSSVLRWFAS
jgi:hypothetical protein